MPSSISKKFRLDFNFNTSGSKRWGFTYDRRWDCPLECMQCVARVEYGGATRQCTRKTCYSLPYCWQHLKKLAHLRIGRTRLVDPGTGSRFKFLGLFACNQGDPGGVVFKRGDVITPYIGEVITTQELDARYPGDDEVAPYVVSMRGDKHVDGACMRGVASLANDAIPGSRCVDGDACVVNAQFDEGDGVYPWLVATGDIRDGDEVFASYGAEYWGGEHKEHTTTPAGAYPKVNYKC